MRTYSFYTNTIVICLLLIQSFFGLVSYKLHCTDKYITILIYIFCIELRLFNFTWCFLSAMCFETKTAEYK